MKKIILLLSVIALTGCSKDWNCHGVIISPYDTQEYDFVFHGTKEEMEAWEESSTYSTPLYPSGSIDNVVECE
jgi:hypothetical protein